MPPSTSIVSSSYCTCTAPLGFHYSMSSSWQGRCLIIIGDLAPSIPAIRYLVTAIGTIVPLVKQGFTDTVVYLEQHSVGRTDVVKSNDNAVTSLCDDGEVKPHAPPREAFVDDYSGDVCEGDKSVGGAQGE